jgi:hypothetical protein
MTYNGACIMNSPAVQLTLKDKTLKEKANDLADSRSARAPRQKPILVWEQTNDRY